MLNWKWIILQDTAMQLWGNSPWQHLVMNTGQFSIQGMKNWCWLLNLYQSCGRAVWAETPLQVHLSKQNLAINPWQSETQHLVNTQGHVSKPAEQNPQRSSWYPSSFIRSCTSQFCCFSPASPPAASRSSNPLLPSFTSAFSVSNTFCPLMSRWITLCWCRWLKPWRIQRKVRGTQVQSMLFSDIPPHPIMLQKWKVHSWS